MVISHYIVSWIQIGGLTCTLIGLFYLSLSVFDHSAIRYVRPLFPAGVAVLIIIAIFTVITATFGWQPAAGPIELVLAAGSFVINYFQPLIEPALLSLSLRSLSQTAKAYPSFSRTWPFRVYRGILDRSKYVRYVQLVAVDLAAAVVLLVLVAQHPGSLSVPGYLVTGIGGVVIVGALQFTIYVLPEWLEKHENVLPLVGFLLSAAGILTSFLPPVLDVLNIQVH